MPRVRRMIKFNSITATKVLTAILFVFVCLFFCIGTIDLSIKNATPFTVLSLLTAYALFVSPTRSAVTGLAVGVFLDSTSGGTYCFNSVALMLISLFVCLIANNIFNKNLKASLVISLLASVTYFVLYWAIFYIIGCSLKESLTYLINFGLPSAVYTAVFILPFYYLFKFFQKLI